MNAALSSAHGVKRRLKQSMARSDSSGSFNSRRSFKNRPRACDWSDGGFDMCLDDDEEVDAEGGEEHTGEEEQSSSDADSLSSSSSDDEEKHVDVVEEDAGKEEDSKGYTDEIVVDALTRHVAVTLNVYMEYYNSIVRGNLQQVAIDYARQASASLSRSLSRTTPLSMDSRGTSEGESTDEETRQRGRKLRAVTMEEVHLWRHKQLMHQKSFLRLPIFPPSHLVAFIWGVVMIVVDGIYSAFLVPVSAAFCYNPSSVSFCNIIEFITGPIYVLNVLLGFHVGFVISCNLRKLFLMRGDLVARFYLRHGGFWLDLVAVVAFVSQIMLLYLNTSWAVQLAVRVLLLLRMVRVYRLIKTMFIASVSSAGGEGAPRFLSSFGMYAVALCFMAAFFINSFACLFYIIADLQGLEKSWIGRYESLFGENATPPTIVLPANRTGMNLKPRHWQLGLYYVTTTLVTVGFGDITPATTAEQLAAVILMLTAACMFAVLISSISEALGSMTADARRGQVVRKKLGEVMQWMVDREVPEKERERILSYYSTVWRQHHKEYQTEVSIFEELPNVLRGKVARSLVRQLLNKSVLLPSRRDPTKVVPWRLHPAHLELLAENFVPVEVMPGHELFIEGAEADNVYLLEEGRLEVWQHESLLHIYENPIWVTGEGPNAKPQKEMRAQWIGNTCLLGFFNILNARRRPMRVRAQVTSKLWRLELESIKPLFRTQLEFIKLMLRMYRHNMVQALQAQPEGRTTFCGLDTSVHDEHMSTLRHTASNASLNGHQPSPSQPPQAQPQQLFAWNEFYAFMRVSRNDPDSHAKVAKYQQLAEQLQKARTSQIIPLLAKAMQLSPIADEMSREQLVLMAAKEQVATDLRTGPSVARHSVTPAASRHSHSKLTRSQSHQPATTLLPSNNSPPQPTVVTRAASSAASSAGSSPGVERATHNLLQ